MGAGASRECFSDRILVHDEPLSEHNLSDPQALLLQEQFAAIRKYKGLEVQKPKNSAAKN